MVEKGYLAGSVQVGNAVSKYGTMHDDGENKHGKQTCPTIYTRSRTCVDSIQPPVFFKPFLSR
jgi:hypothetical protein